VRGLRGIRRLLRPPAHDIRTSVFTHPHSLNPKPLYPKPSTLNPKLEAHTPSAHDLRPSVIAYPNPQTLTPCMLSPQL